MTIQNNRSILPPTSAASAAGPTLRGQRIGGFFVAPAPATTPVPTPATQNPPNTRNLVKCPKCTRVLGADTAGLSFQRTHDYEWLGLMIQIKCRCGQVLAAEPEVVSAVLRVLGELRPLFAAEHRALLTPDTERKAA